MSHTGLVARDTLRMVQYNLMQYMTNQYGGCTQETNNLNDKDEYLKQIFGYLNPQIIAVNEIGSKESDVNRILDNVLNINGVDYWKRGQLSNLSGGTLANMVYYDSRKLILIDNVIVPTSLRDINIYKFCYNTPHLEEGDTIFFYSIIAHLKAGTTGGDVRFAMVQALMSRLENWGVSENYVFSGDFNVYGSSEQAYQFLINHSNPMVRFHDPIDMPGNWNNNYQFRNIHTQSTHTAYDNCYASGGLDDRFDFILVSSPVLNGYDNIKALPETYQAVGQDGNRFNGTVNYPTNESVPQELANTLYLMSDHLPVVMDFLVYYPTAGVENYQKKEDEYRVINPFENEIKITFLSEKSQKIEYALYDSQGRRLKSGKYIHYHWGQEKILDVENLNSGIYFLNLINAETNKTVKLYRL